MLDILLLCAAMLVGFLILFKSADEFVVGSIATAKNISVSPMIIGLTIVALGTSAPEIFVAITSSLQGEAHLAVGNAIGSNIANVGMVLGITALIIPLRFKVELLREDIPILIFVTVCCGIALVDFKLDIWDGLLLFFGLALFLWRLVSEKGKSSEIPPEIEELVEIPEITTKQGVIRLIISLLFLLASAELLVWSAINIAQSLGVSELVIGLTIIAVGTSLPELMVSLASSLKGQTDLAIGNIVGSNIFNILAVLSIPCILAPTEVGPQVFWRDYLVMLLLTAALIFFAVGKNKERKISRIKGALLLAIWLGYLITLYNTAIAS